MKHLGLFEGIGGFSLAARNVGWETLAWCEWNEFGQKVLRHHFPNAEGFGDITKTNFKKYANTIDIITGGFPCQPYSLAGKRKGKEDERHLWPEMLRVIREVQPRWVVGENVFGLINWSDGLVFHEVQADLEAEGYEVWAYVLPAAAVNAPHRRDRVWFVAKNANQNGWRSNKWKSKSNIGKFWNTCSGNNEWLQTNNRQINQNATNTNSNGLNECNSKHEVNTSEGGEYALNDINTDAMHTNSIRWIQDYEKQQAKQSKQRVSRFRDFPTQSPICGGDDGLPTELDGITFPKWRAESIKAYGNAIVPQVAEQIFRTIIDYENTL